MPYTKYIKQKIRGYDVKFKFEFNTEDIGLSVTTTAKTEFFKKFAENIVNKSFVKDFPEFKQFLTDEMGEKGYEGYMTLYKENLAHYVSWAKEIDNQDEVETKVKCFEDGRCETFINDRLKEKVTLRKDTAEKTIRALRSSAIHGKEPEDRHDL